MRTHLEMAFLMPLGLCVPVELLHRPIFLAKAQCVHHLSETMELMRGKEPVALPLLSITVSPLPTLIANFSPVTHFPVFPFKTVCLFFFPTWIVFGALSWGPPR